MRISDIWLAIAEIKKGKSSCRHDRVACLRMSQDIIKRLSLRLERTTPENLEQKYSLPIPGANIQINNSVDKDIF